MLVKVWGGVLQIVWEASVGVCIVLVLQVSVACTYMRSVAIMAWVLKGDVKYTENAEGVADA